MPAAPGATPRKMLPPPITAPISTPSRDTCATSATMCSIVWRLMPNGSSPIRASPESLSRIRLYLGVTARCHCGSSPGRAGLRHHFGGEVGRPLLDALAHHEERVGVDLGLLRGEVLLHALLVVLDERLSHQRDLAAELVERALDHFLRDLLGLAGFLRARELDRALAIDDFGRHLGLGHVLRPGEGDVHGDVL